MLNFKSILRQNKDNIALVSGNGINRYNTNSSNNSWETLLQKLSQYYLLDKNIPEGITLTEFYDLLELKSGSEVTDGELQKNFCKFVSDWESKIHHKYIVQWAINNKAPILTTNFDNTLGKAADGELLKITRDRFTDYYPWTCYYSHTILFNPCAGFGIWHINGMEYYHRSIRLGLRHYMGSVQRVRSWIYPSKEDKDRDRSLMGRDSEEWRGRDTWLHIIFNKPLLFFGLGLNENEVFLRWLMIERARYFRKYPERKQSAWYVYSENEDDISGKLYFLDGVGIEPLKVNNFDEIYGSSTWEQ